MFLLSKTRDVVFKSSLVRSNLFSLIKRDLSDQNLFRDNGHTSEFRRQYGGSTAAVRRQYGGSTAAVPRQCHGSATAVPRQYSDNTYIRLLIQLFHEFDD